MQLLSSMARQGAERWAPAPVQWRLRFGLSSSVPLADWEWLRVNDPYQAARCHAQGKQSPENGTADTGLMQAMHV